MHDRINAASAAEAAVASRLSRLGYYVTLSPLVVAETKTERLSGQWPCDLEIWRTESQRSAVEVKCKNAFFGDDPSTWKFKDVALCANRYWHKKKWGTRTEAAFVFVSSQTKSMLAVPIGVPVYMETITDQSRGQTYRVVCCETEFLRTFDEVFR